MATDSITESAEKEQSQKVGILAWFKKNIWGLITIIAVTAVCVTIVQVLKKPGQMSVIESQAMDMNAMVPPKGAVPVAIATVELGNIQGSVTYTGTIQAYTDEDVYPRLTGRVVSMPVYPGDRVRKGQLLVQLDPFDNSEYSAKKEEAAGADDAAVHNAGIAKEEFDQKRHELEAAKQAEEAAKNSVAEAEASLSYWSPELARQKALLESKVVSLDEYQKEAAELMAAQARLAQAKAKLLETASMHLAAQAAFDGSVHHVGHFSSAARQAKAALKNATIYEKYTRIVAQDDGVVTKRIISPGVVVNPGMLLLKVAHIRQVRVQAEVATEDAQNLRVGNKVYIKDSESSKQERPASITAIFPAADPASRTFTVEALINNVVEDEKGMAGDYRFLPGQYVVMRLLTGEQEGLLIPSSAVIWREGKSQVWKASSEGEYTSVKKYQCPMHPEVISDKAGSCPKCGMTLEPVSTAAETEKSDLSAKTKYTCPMHPEVRSDKPGSCPKCGMTLEPVSSENRKEKSAVSAKKQYTCTMHPEVLSDMPGKCPKCGMDLTPKELGSRKVAQLVDVQVGLANADKTEVRSGLSQGDQVIFAGFARLQPGMPIVATEWGKTGPLSLPLASEVGGKRLDASNNWNYEEMAGALMIKVSLSPAKGGSNSVVVKVDKHGGGALAGARVSIRTSMPGMNMPGPDLNGTTGLNGEVSLNSDLMSGLWQLKLTVTPPGQESAESTLDAEVP